MNIILIDPAEVKNNRVTLRDRRSDHISKVLGAVCGDTLRTGLINGPMGTSTVVAITVEAVELVTNHHGPAPGRPAIDLILALPRPIMLKRIFSQAATFGVRKIYLINASRVEKSFFSASLLTENNYYPLLLHGLEQAVDTMVPEVSIHKRFRPFVEDVLPQAIDDCPVRLAAHPGPFPFLPQTVSLPLKQRVVIAIGPEGGWVDFEIDKFQSLGFQTFSMGPRILRVDSAVPALLAQLNLLRQINRQTSA
ncbi:MAG: 16S rRNA (uracil(1498)-N(3))-methyltransferase [Proteobacteria bacterium]|nr:16S rRNA (uracil(1498)-N(3))-methyltransferase [Pseudomonadota bacterium]MBU4296281.1 16S rRNA (uracil(1498)-N(3))-methyltransferase [Pseudomonadota bacterium]MCG2748629.1 16S rRNA (uracil(1498)-N(3))-methyltransferase [Desulfobulbaceae bacterium]